MTLSHFFRVLGILGIVFLSLIACLVGTVLVAFVVGVLFNKYFL